MLVLEQEHDELRGRSQQLERARDGGLICSGLFILAFLNLTWAGLVMRA